VWGGKELPKGTDKNFALLKHEAYAKGKGGKEFVGVKILPGVHKEGEENVRCRVCNDTANGRLCV